MSEESLDMGIKALRKQRGVIKGTLTRFQTFLERLSGIDEINKNEISQLKVKLEKVEPLWDKFNDIQEEIELGLTEEDMVKECIERESFENSYAHVVGIARDLVEANSNTFGENSSVAGSISPQAVVELPKVNLPSFEGKWEEYGAFKEEFMALVGNRTDLLPVQKFRYLISAVKGSAALALKSMEISNQTYHEAWEALDHRFDNKRRTINRHIRAILDMTKIEKANAAKIQNLIDTISAHLRSLRALEVPVKHWDAIIVQIVFKKLDTATQHQWEQVGNKNDIPTIAELINFLQDKVARLEAINEEKQSNMQHKDDSRLGQGSKLKALVASRPVEGIAMNSQPCEYCAKPHKIFVCQMFRKLAVTNRISEIKRLGLCANCFRQGHAADQCNGLPCRKCSKKHNTLLHSEKEKKASEEQSISTSAFAHNTTGKRAMVFLSTAVIHVLDRNGKAVECRVLLDSGSQSNFVSQDLANRLALTSSSPSIAISGIGGKLTAPLNAVKCSIKSRFEKVNLELECLVLPRITLPIPEAPVDIASWKIPKGMFLADPDFCRPNDVDMLIGAEQFFSIMQWQQVSLGENFPHLQRTSLGWVIVGKLKPQREALPPAVVQCGCSLTIEESLKKFWETEELSQHPVLSAEEKLCEKIFQDTTTRDPDGRFIVQLPTKKEIDKLGESEQMALKRFYSLENKLKKSETLRTAYNHFMQEYLQLGHMIPTSTNDKDKEVYYLPHHCVTNAYSSTTKLRVVFDASAKSTTNLSLNDVLMVGPSIQRELFAIVLRFRQHRFVMTADITKMYRQIKLTDKHSKLHMIFWRKDPTEPVKKYKLTTVTYGTAPASYLATRCLKQAALEYTTDFPSGSNAILEDFYMDDLVYGCDDFNLARQTKKEVVQILAGAGFHLHKWCANDERLLEDIPIEMRESKYIPEQSDSSIKALGVWWNPGQDRLKYSINLFEIPNHTKRSVLAEASRLFDPLGLVGPVVVKAKIFLQALWAAGVNWDDPLTPSQKQEWEEFRKELIMLEKINIPRSVRHKYNTEVEIHGFSDASEKAYGAVVYVKTCSANGGCAQLLCAKSRVAPLKKMTLPRLELCGALLLARLIAKVEGALTLKFTRKMLWCDSTIVLAWLHAPSSRWRTFVANRVSEIQELTTTYEWRHVESADNPADKISRGLMPSQIIDDEMWWTGSKWLSGLCKDYPLGREIDQSIVEEQVPLAMASVSPPEPIIDWKKFSSFSKLVRVVARIKRFLKRKRSTQEKPSPFISGQEWCEAERTIIHMVQMESFTTEIECLQKKDKLNTTSKVLSLCPFLDENGMLRVGGRIKNAEIAYEQKHPLMLPDKHWVTQLIFSYYHVKHLHAGAQLLLAAVRHRYWPLNGKNSAKKAVRTCMRCAKCNPKEACQIMGDLPKERVVPIRAFYNCGVDYCGPININVSNHRTSRTCKAYICIFVCFTSKATHIELVSDMTAMTFLAALKRFFARRGKASCLFSDNGTNFVGAQRELHEAFAQAIKDPRVANYLSEDGIEWKFIPPRAPQFGGLWEAAVKACKYHLKRMIGEQILSYEEMATLLTLIEATLNSRPLCPLSPDPNDLSSITPGHFLIGDAITAAPQPGIVERKISTLRRWHRVEHMFQQFWIRWRKEYLSLLQPRTKWQKEEVNLKTGQLVLMKDELVPPLKWPLARIVDVHPGADDKVRVVTLKTANGIFTRPATKVCPLPTEEEKIEAEE